jgi:predicted dienelactone hydrolase
MAGDGAKFPVLIFASGRGGYRQSSTFEVEELVSHGYIVVGIDQPYTATDVAFPDGRHVQLDDRVAASVLDEHVVDDTFMLAVFDYLGRDAAFALDQLTAIDQSDPQGILTGRLDLQSTGIFGTSLGGITAAEGCRLDARFKACLILDVAMPPDVVQSGLQQPAMWINADADDKRLEGWTPSDIREQQSTVQAVLSGLRSDGYSILIPGMYHADITDLPNIFPEPVSTMVGATGPMDTIRTHAAINAYSLAFFDQYLKSESQPLLARPSAQFPEIGLDKR